MTIDTDGEIVRATLGWLGDQATPAPPFERFEGLDVSLGAQGGGDPAPGAHRRRWQLALAAAAVVVALGGVGVAVWSASGTGEQRLDTGPAEDPVPTAPTSAPPPPSSVPSPESEPYPGAGDEAGEPAEEETSSVVVEPRSPAENEALAAALADLAGASTVIYGRQTDDRTGDRTWDRHLSVWQAGTVTRIGPLGDWAWADAWFVYSGIELASGNAVDVYRHDGSLVCSVTLADNEWVHHATARPDGSVVLGVSRSVESPSHDDEADALDCASGRRTPIEPVVRWTDEASYEQVERVGGRTFRIFGDAEGNAGTILDEQGRNLIEGDYAGSLVFAGDGSRMAYGEHSRAPSPHVTSSIRVRSTTDGELLWSATLPEFLTGQMWFVGDRLVVPQTPNRNVATGAGPRTAIVFDAATGAELGTVELPDGVGFVG